MNTKNKISIIDYRGAFHNYDDIQDFRIESSAAKLFSFWTKTRVMDKNDVPVWVDTKITFSGQFILTERVNNET